MKAGDHILINWGNNYYEKGVLSFVGSQGIGLAWVDRTGYSDPSRYQINVNLKAVIPVPKNATEDQIEALKKILCEMS